MASVVLMIKGRSQAGTGIEEIDAGGGHDALVEVRPAAVVAKVVGGDVERGDPEDLGPRQLGLGNPDSGLCRGHDQRPRIGKPQGGREVDREPKVGRRQGRGLRAPGWTPEVKAARRPVRLAEELGPTLRQHAARRPATQGRPGPAPERVTASVRTRACPGPSD